jgi:hypothetical protein
MIFRTKLDDPSLYNSIFTDFAPTLHRLCTDFGTEEERRKSEGS